VAATPTLEQVLLDVDGHVASVTLNRPEQRNPLSATMLRDLAAALSWCRDEREVRAGAEGAIARAGEDDDARLGFGLAPAQRARQVAEHRRAEWVALLRPVQRDGGDAALDRYEDLFKLGRAGHS